MNKEVKELIDKLKDNNNADDVDENGYFFALYISDKDLLLDYINQLETNRDGAIKLLQENVAWGEDMNSQQAIEILERSK